MITYKQVLRKKADLGIPGAPQLINLNRQAAGTGTSFDRANNASKGLGYTRAEATLSPEAKAANTAWAQGFRDYLANPENGDLWRNVRNGANGAVNAFQWGAPRAAAGLLNIGSDVLQLPGNLWGFGNYALGGAGKPLYEVPKIDTSNWHSTHFRADPSSGQAGAFVGQFGMPAAGATALKHAGKLRSMAKYRKEAPMRQAQAWRGNYAPAPQELTRARQVQQAMQIPHAASDFASKDAYIKHLQKLRAGLPGVDLPTAYELGQQILRGRAYNQIAAKYGYSPIKTIGISSPRDVALSGQIPTGGSFPKFIQDLYAWQDANRVLSFAPRAITSQPKTAERVLRAINKTQWAPNTTLGRELKRFSRGNNDLLYKGWRGRGQFGSEVPGNLQHHLQRSGDATTNRWFGGLPQTSLSPSYSGKGANFAVIQVPRKNSPIQRLRQRLQPHMGASVPAGSPTEVYDAMRANPSPNFGHYEIGASPQYEFVARPSQWQKIPQLKHKVYILGDYKGNQVSNFRRLNDPIPNQVADIPLIDTSRPWGTQKNPKYWYNTPFLKQRTDMKSFIPSLVGVRNK